MIFENSQLLLCFGFSLFSGALAAVMGLGGGVILVPVLTLIVGVPFPVAAATSIVAVVAASNGAAIKFHKSGLTNVNLGLWLELGTVSGAVTGVFLTGLVPEGILFSVFAVVLLMAVFTMLKGRKDQVGTGDDVVPNTLSQKLGINTKEYKVDHPLLGAFLSIFAGMISSMLGVGGGIIKLPLMNSVMKVPLKSAVATSSFMIGITAASGAFMYLLQGRLELSLIAPTVVGVMSGAYIASHFVHKLPVALIKKSFAVVAFIVAIRMLLKGWETL